jgi:hypothetical protein
MVKITFPDGSVREYEQGVTGLQIAESISPALARDVVSCGVNGETTELNRPINEDAKIALYKFDDDEGKHTFWHTSAHLLAEALQELYPGIQFGFGPAIENGFFYDVMPKKGDVISESDFARIEEKMRELAKKNEPVVRRDVSKSDALKEFKADGQEYKCEHIDQDLEDGTISTYTQGAFTDLCRGPHLVSTGAIKAIKITSVAGAFWRGDAKREQMTRIYGISFPKKKMLDEYLVMLEEAKKRDHRKIGKEMDLDGPRYSSGHAALHHRIGILSETHMLKPYADRVNATFQLMLATLAVLNEQGAALRTARAQAREHTRTATHFGFNHRLDTTHVEQLPWKGYRPRTAPSAVSGLPRLQYDHSQPTDTVVPWMDRFVPAFTLAKPAAYLIPQAWHELITRLELDGVPLERLPADTSFTVTAQRIAAHTTVQEPFEGRYLHRGIRTTTDTLVYQARAGDVRVPMGHATDRLAMEILEPRAADSFFAWGFFDPILQQKEWFSDYVFEDIAADLLASDPALRQALEATRAADPALANDAWGQLYWVYQRSPYFEPGYRLVPVFSIR